MDSSVNININDVVRELGRSYKITVCVTGLKVFRLRLWAVKRLLQLAAFLSNGLVEVVDGNR